MKRRFVISLICAVATFLAGLAAFANLSPASNPGVVEAAPGKVTQGALQVIDKDGKLGGQCPLKHTDVKAAVSGSLARVTVTQEFQNPLNEKIEAVYVFPLPHESAVDSMTMVVGDRRIVGIIKRREEARREIARPHRTPRADPRCLRGPRRRGRGER